MCWTFIVVHASIFASSKFEHLPSAWCVSNPECLYELIRPARRSEACAAKLHHVHFLKRAAPVHDLAMREERFILDAGDGIGRVRFEICNDNVYAALRGSFPSASI